MVIFIPPPLHRLSVHLKMRGDLVEGFAALQGFTNVCFPRPSYFWMNGAARSVA
jgi:hypothetical protein